MGTTLSRQDQDVQFADIKFVKDPFRLTDRERAGRVFVISYHPAAPSPSAHPPRRHYSVVVDVSGESDDSLLVGKELTIDIDSSTGAIFFDFRPLKGRWPLGQLASWKCLGRLPLPPDLFGPRSYPEFWGTRLDTAAAELFQQMGLTTESNSRPHEPSRVFAWRLASFLLGREDFGSLSDSRDFTFPSSPGPVRTTA